jgi:ribosomal protein S18 acetylase RimI-like enzyme
MNLPDGWSYRPATLDDVPGILDLMIASDIAALGEPDSTADLVEQILCAPNTEAVVVTDGAGRIVGSGALLNETRADRDNIDVYVYPDEGAPALTPLVRWAVDGVARRAAAWGRPVLTARCALIATEVALVDALTAEGFGFVKRYARMRVDLPSPVATKADGVTIRLFAHDDPGERLTFHRILQEAFADTPDFTASTPEDWWAKIDALPSVDWSEWWIALVDGVPAGVLQSDTVGVEQGEGWVKNLAVRREYRSRGIAKALLSTAFVEYAAKGRTRAGLGVDLTNPTGAYDLYRAVGMYPAFEADMYERVVSAASA